VRYRKTIILCDVLVASAAITAGGAIAGGVLANKGKKASSTSSNTPWAPQGDQLEKVYGEAENLYNATAARPAWEATNPTTAGLNATQQEGAGVAAGYARGTGGTLADTSGQTAGALLGAGGSYAGNAGALYANGAGAANPTSVGILSRAANGGALGSSGMAGSTGLMGQTGALSSAQSLAARGQTDLNPSIQASAAGYMNSDLINGQVDAATRDVSRSLNEETLPGLNSRAMGGGNLNSARAGAAESVARRGAEDRAADISTDIRNNAYNTGISSALAANGQQNSLSLGALSQASSSAGALSSLGENQRQFDTSTQVGAAQSLGALDMSNRSLDSQTRLAANGQLGNATSLGFQGALTTGALTDANAGRIGAQGDFQQSEEQRLIDQQRTQYYAEEERRKAAIQEYYGIVGGGNPGSNKTGTETTAGPGVVAGALGGAAGAYGLYNSFSGAGAATGAGGTASGGALSMGKLFSPTANGGSKGALYSGS
jgi:hypothetical protein